MIDDTRQSAVGYIRESTRRQDKGYSPEVQRGEIEACAQRHGYTIVRWYRDTQRGRVIERADYQAMLTDVRQGTVHAVFVFRFDRTGRDSHEFTAFAQELWKRRVPFYSVRQGQDKPGIMRGVWGGLSEEELVQLAQRVRPACEASARAGNHAGVTPYGYRRPDEIPVVDGRPAPRPLLVDADAAAVVREMFARAARGQSTREIALWANAATDAAASPGGKRWATDSVRYVLHNPVYHGAVRYNAHSTGYYDRCEPGSAFVADGRHEAIIDVALYQRVQDRLTADHNHPVRARISKPVPLAAGVMMCAACGGRMTVERRQHGGASEQYACLTQKLGRTACQGKRYTCDLAHEALLAQIGRLRGQPWADRALATLGQSDPLTSERARLQAEVRDFEAAMARHVERFSAVDGDLTDEMLAAFRARGEQLSAAIREGKAALAALPVASTPAATLAALHQEIATVQLGDIARQLVAASDVAAARALILKVLDTAVVVERMPANHARWLRVAVTWSPAVRVLLDAGLLSLAPDVPAPDIAADADERRRQRQRAYRQRQRASVDTALAAATVDVLR